MTHNSHEDKLGTLLQLDSEGSTNRIDRRKALGLMGFAAIATVAAGCGGGTKTSSSTSSTSSNSSSSCAVTPEGEEGPYFVDDSASGFNRSNILSNLDGTNTQSGIPLTLKLYMYDSQNSCAAMQNVQVDIWHCNADGVYSDESVESTLGETWCRGYQLTDANGLVTFNTIVPGWYSGRTAHIHLRLRSTYDSSSTSRTNTTQLFFPQSLIDTINTTVAPYSTHGTNSTTNASDHVYAPETLGETLLTLTGDTTNGYTATFKIDLPIT